MFSVQKPSYESAGRISPKHHRRKIALIFFKKKFQNDLKNILTVQTILIAQINTKVKQIQLIFKNGYGFRYVHR